MIKYTDILTNKDARDKALAIMEERINTATRGVAYYRNPKALLDKLIKTWKFEELLINTYPWLHYIGDDHDGLFEKSDPWNYADVTPDFVRDDGITLDLKVEFYHMSALIKFNKISSYHNANLILIFSIQDYLTYPENSGWYLLNKDTGYQHIEPVNSIKLDQIAKQIIEINNKTYID